MSAPQDRQDRQVHQDTHKDASIELEKLLKAESVVSISSEPPVLPGDVQTWEQLEQIPEEFLNFTTDGASGKGWPHGSSTLNNLNNVNTERPLRHTDAHGNTYTYSLSPVTFSVFLILILELLERFSFYGLYMTQTNFLTGSYNVEEVGSEGSGGSGGQWTGPDMSSMEAASLVSLSTAVAYTIPFVGGFLADALLGDYRTILLGTLLFYLPGLLLISLSTLPNPLLGQHHFNTSAYRTALLVFWPIGTGIVKSVVNVFGARQYHPILQRSMIESFYVRFYMIINVGAVAGCIVIPVVARSDVTVAYGIPLVLLVVATGCFVGGSKRYVDVVPQHEFGLGVGSESDDGHGGNGGNSMDEEVGGGHGSRREASSFLDVAKICMLVVPFNIAYSQCPTTFMVQGAVMKPFLGVIEAPNLDIIDSISVLFFGYLVSTYFYPYLARRNIKLNTGYKFAIGSALGGCAILWSLLLEHMIHAEYATSGDRINVLWQAPSYLLIGAGEIFSISAAYEVAFTASPPNKKAFACAFNLFCIGGIPNMLSLGLYRMCKQWFQNERGSGNIHLIQDYSEAHVANYFLVLLGIVFFGVFVNLLPSVRNWIASVEKRAADAASSSAANTPKATPKSTPKSTPKFTPRVGKTLAEDVGKGTVKETDPLLKAKEHKKYLEEGKGPQIYRMNTMKAEFAKKPKGKRRK